MTLYEIEWHCIKLKIKSNENILFIYASAINYHLDDIEYGVDDIEYGVDDSEYMN